MRKKARSIWKLSNAKPTMDTCTQVESLRAMRRREVKFKKRISIGIYSLKSLEQQTFQSKTLSYGTVQTHTDCLRNFQMKCNGNSGKHDRHGWFFKLFKIAFRCRCHFGECYLCILLHVLSIGSYAKIAQNLINEHGTRVRGKKRAWQIFISFFMLVGWFVCFKWYVRDS